MDWIRTLRRLALEQAAGGAAGKQDLPQFGVEGLHDAMAGDGFVEDVLDFRELVLAGAGAGAHLTANFARGGDDDRNEEDERPTEDATEANDKDESDQEGEELLQEFADDGADRECTRSTSLISVERMVPVACLWKKLEERLMVASRDDCAGR